MGKVHSVDTPENSQPALCQKAEGFRRSLCPPPLSVACPMFRGLPPCTLTRPRAHGSHRITGTVERLLKGDPAMTRVLYARYPSVRCARSTMRTTRVSLKMSDVRSRNTSASVGSCVRSTVIGPTCQHTSAKREGSSATPTVPCTLPVHAWEREQGTPGTLGASKAFTPI